MNAQDAEDQVARAREFVTNGEFDKAIDACNQALRLFDSSNTARIAVTYMNRGNAWASKGDSDKAIDDYNDAIRLNPTSAKAYYNRGSVWEENGRYRQGHC